MPTIFERLGSRLLRSGLGDAMLREERAKLEQAVRVMQNAYAYGPWVRPPDVVAQELQELDPWVLTDVLSRVGWDIVGMLGAEAQRQRAVQESRRLYHYSPIAQWAIWLWTSWGLGEKVAVRLSDPDAQEWFDEFWTADRNAAMLGADRFHELSNWLLIDGNTFLTFHVSTVDGECTLGEVDPDEINEIITHPGSKKHPLFYKRVPTSPDKVMGKDGKEYQEVYYPDWAAWMSGELDREFQGSEGKTLAQVVLTDPNAYRMDLQATMGEEPWRKAQLGGKGKNNEAGTAVCALHIHHNHKKRNSLWGWPLLSTDTPWVKAHRQFIEARLAVAQSKAMYVRRKQVAGGSRAVDAVIQQIQSTLSQSQYYDTNPPPPPGSIEVENRAVDTTDLPMTTGAGDARADNALFAWHALLGAGLFPASAGLDLQRYATALAMDKSQSMLWNRYQAFWSAQLERMARIVVHCKQRYTTDVQGAAKGKEVEQEEFTVDVSIDTFSLADFPDVSAAIGGVAAKMLIPMAQTGVPVDTVKRIWAALWRPMLQSLGVSDAVELTDEEAFEYGEAAPEEEEEGLGAVPVQAPPPAAGAAVATERIVEMIRESAEATGEVDWQRVAEASLGMLTDWEGGGPRPFDVVEGGPGSGNWGHRGIPGQQGGSMARSAGWGAGQVPREFWTQGPGQEMIEDLPPHLQLAVVQTCSREGVQYWHVEGIKDFTDEPPDCLDCDGWWYVKGWTMGEIQGYYDHEGGIIHLNPSAGGINFTVAHELGHHVRTRMSLQKQNTWYRATIALSGKNDKELARVGLRPYSVSRPGELAADSFAVRLFGTDEQKEGLARGLGVTSLDDFFGQPDY